MKRHAIEQDELPRLRLYLKRIFLNIGRRRKRGRLLRCRQHESGSVLDREVIDAEKSVDGQRRRRHEMLIWQIAVPRALVVVFVRWVSDAVLLVQDELASNQFPND